MIQLFQLLIQIDIYVILVRYVYSLAASVHTVKVECDFKNLNNLTINLKI